MKKIVVVFGTRPEAIKLSPVIRRLKQDFDVVTVSTGQHRELLEQVIDLLGIRVDHELGVMTENQTLTNLTCVLHRQIADVFEKEKPDLVVVQGDTHTVVVSALEAYYHQIPIAHVEAGLRTDDIYNPFPEEGNRRIVSQIASFNFAPTETAHKRLLREKVPGKSLVTGNTGIDTLLSMARGLVVAPTNQVLVTLHRRESFGDTMKGMLEALAEFVEINTNHSILFPVHPNPNVKKMVYEVLGDHPRIKLVSPLNYEEMVEALLACRFVITDSGGLQEEAPSLKKPVLVLRNTTERPEGVERGLALLVGTDPKKIVKEATRLATSPQLYKQMTTAPSPYGDGRASERIAEYLKENL